MKCLKYKPKFEYKNEYTTVMAASCWHLGNPSVHMEGIDRFMEKAQSHDWIHHGDIIEGITPSDRRFEHGEHTAALLSTIDDAVDKVKEAASSCIGIIQGNHEATPSREIGDIAETISMRSGVTYLSDVTFIEFECPDGTFTGFFAHGNGTANYRIGEPERKAVNKQIKLRQILQSFNADICGMGHLHKSITTAPCAEMRLSMQDMVVKRRPVVVRPGWYYATPSMFKTYDQDLTHGNYGSRSLFPAVDIGWIEFDISRSGEIKCLREVDEKGSTLEERTITVVR